MFLTSVVKDRILIANVPKEGWITKISGLISSRLNIIHQEFVLQGLNMYIIPRYFILWPGTSNFFEEVRKES